MIDHDDIRGVLSAALADEPRPPTAEQITARALLDRPARNRLPLRVGAALLAAAFLMVALVTIGRRNVREPAAPVRTPDRVWVAASLPPDVVLLDVDTQLPTPSAIGLAGHGGRVVFRRADPPSLLSVETVISVAKDVADDGRRIRLRDGEAQLAWPEDTPNDSLGLSFWRDGVAFTLTARGVLPDEIATIADALTVGDGAMAVIDPASQFTEDRREPFGVQPVSVYRVTYGQLDAEWWAPAQVETSRYAGPVDARLGLSLFAEPVAGKANAWVDGSTLHWQPQPDTIVTMWASWPGDSPSPIPQLSDLAEVTANELDALVAKIGEGMKPRDSWRIELPGGPVTLDWIGPRGFGVSLLCTTGSGSRRCRFVSVDDADGVAVLATSPQHVVDGRWLIVTDHHNAEPEIDLPFVTIDDGRWDVYEVPSDIDDVVMLSDATAHGRDRGNREVLHRPMG